MRRAGNTPPSKQVPSGPLKENTHTHQLIDVEDVMEVIGGGGGGHFTNAISASHSKKLSSLTGPATMPSGGSKVNSVVKHKEQRKSMKRGPWLTFKLSLRLYSAIKRLNAGPAISV